ncbi:hypothetical protein HRR83_005741 [Exophiala dermatitidis]|uniref:Uncharacterized protein n=1 Tax=Exophiala dermatitidis TaxID=5970 RepID=A0AAN6IR76_EXODE|nr:hypothetical protein HRR73_007316 [Exophiala dermatitidis]KAJ4513297.1 hypothetical protein HRR74_006109 [Exophiala dermatitidis]KAJ4538152.1 hypothetical protein HRR77_007192 [Exophiala dermatitidis]KAJ4539887.1 hypothetical protein HRR76_003318 [Exophiala dermatitidis]KAJ4562444.1 hypothetical protein HRR79_006770 [Exophiala dermatitidis]
MSLAQMPKRRYWILLPWRKQVRSSYGLAATRDQLPPAQEPKDHIWTSSRLGTGNGPLRIRTLEPPLHHYAYLYDFHRRSPTFRFVHQRGSEWEIVQTGTPNNGPQAAVSR